MIVYRYGCKPPRENAERVEEQFALAHRYYNRLVEIERARRALIPPRCPCAVTDPLFRCACAPCSAANGTPGVHCGTDDAAWAFARAMAAGHATAWAAEHVRRARAACGCYWGTYLLVEAAIDAARKAPTPPDFASWWRTRRHRIGVQLQGGLVIEEAFGGEDTRLRITPYLGDCTPGSARAQRQHLVQLRVGSDGRKPVWASFVAQIHRLPPEGGRIKWAWAQCDRRGPPGSGMDQWSVHLTVEGDAARDPHAVEGRKGVVAIDLGWRARPDGFRVGYWRDDAGKHGELVVPESIFEDLALGRDLEGRRRLRFNSMRDRLAEWCADRAGTLPAWLARESPYLAQWKSIDRLARLVRYWLTEGRFDGDGEIVEPTATCPRDDRGVVDCAAHVECWVAKDRDLLRWHDGLLARTLGRRDETYRRLAATLARRYAVVVIEAFALPKVAGRRGLRPTATDGEKVRADNASSRRHAVAPGMFRLALVNACRARGTVVVARPCAWTTIDCATCGARLPWNAAPAIDHRCAACGDTWDQDDQACANLLASYRASGPVVPESPEVLAGGKSARQQRFARRRDRKRKSDATVEADRSRMHQQAHGMMMDTARTAASPAHEEVS